MTRRANPVRARSACDCMPARSTSMTTWWRQVAFPPMTDASPCPTAPVWSRPWARVSRSSRRATPWSPPSSRPGWRARLGNFATTPGDGVDGYAREQVVAKATAFTRQPAGWSHAESATLTTAGLTAWRALVVDGGLKAGDTVLVLGTGGVSIFALQFAKMMGARVIATSSSDEKLERLRELGAEHTINYREDPEWGRTVRELTGGEGVDQVVEVGGPGTLPQSIEAVRIGGHIALIGVLTGGAGEVPTAKLMARQASLRGLIVGSRRHQLEMIRAIEVSGLKPVIDREFPLEAIADAFRHQEGGRHFGKICLTW